MSGITENQVRERLADVWKRIERHEVALAYLQQEAKRLEIAVSVFDHFHDRPDFDEILPPEANEPEPPPENRKPSDIPPIPVMVQDVLAHEELFNPGDGVVALEPREITAKIRAKWWPDAKAESIRPIVWRMWKKGHLQKVGDAYALVPAK